MTTKIIKVYDILHDQHPISKKDGEMIYNAIRNEFNLKHNVIVDFSDIISLTTAVINNSISVFVNEMGIKELSKCLNITGLADENMKNTINLSLSLAQSIYQANQKGQTTN